MKMVWRFIRKWWWVFLVAAVTVVFTTWRVLRPTSNPTAPVPPPNLDKAREEVERIHLEAEVEKARVRAQADAQRAELDRIEEQGEKDPAAAREALAEWLNANL
jgi:hypothetical protein